MISLDTECGGLDLHHGASSPFFITTCDHDGTIKFWEWDVDPLTRKPHIPEGDIQDIQEYLFADGPHGPIGDYEREDGGLIGQNLKFDFSALKAINFWDGTYDIDEAWKNVHDTLIAGHLLASNQPHDLTSMVMHYLGIDIEPAEKKLQETVEQARRLARSKLKDWRIAKKGDPDMPSAKDKTWRADYWLPRAICKEARQQYRTWIKDVVDDGTWEKIKKVVGGRTWESLKEIVDDRTWGNIKVVVDDGTWEKIKDKFNKHSWYMEYAQKDHPWNTVLRDYSNKDSETTILLWMKMREILHERGLWEIYQESMKSVPVVFNMEQTGITLSKSRHGEMKEQATQEIEDNGEKCVELAAKSGVQLTLPKSGSNQSIRDYCFKTLNLPVLARSDITGEPSLDKYDLENYMITLDDTGDGYKFIEALKAKRARDTAYGFLCGYERFWLPHQPENEHTENFPRRNRDNEGAVSKSIHRSVTSNNDEETMVLHPSINLTGSQTLRFSCQNPNAQNVSAKEDFSLRYCFGPAEGREWYWLDYENIELRIPFYVANEKAGIELFEKSDEPPYFGSYHLLNASIIYPDLFWPLSDKKGAFKEKYERTWYQWCKNFGFGIQYQAGEETADKAAHKRGSWRLVKENLKGLTKLNDEKVREAEKKGWVETMPDRTVNPKRGYPLICTRSEWGKILPTVPLNYFVQGTACWCVKKAMTRCSDYLKEVNSKRKGGYRMIMNIHDELLFDFPKDKERNIPIIKNIQKLMEQSGDDVGIPLKVAIKYSDNNWSKGVAL